jgi:predicted Zn-dependent protease
MTYARALRAFDLRQWKLARKYLTEELANNPQSSAAYSLLAAVELNTNETDKSIEHAKTSIGINPNSAYPYYILGLGLMRSKQTFEGEIALEEALCKDPTNPAYLTACGSIRRNADKNGMDLLDQALEQDAAYLPAWHAKYNKLVALNKKREADEIRKRILELDPEDAGAHQDLGWKYLTEFGGDAKALDHFQEALRLDPMEHKSVAGLQEAHYLVANPFARLFKKFWWRRIFVSLAVTEGCSMVYMVICDQLHVAVNQTFITATFMIPVLIIAVGCVFWALGATVYYTGMIIDGWKRGFVQERYRHFFAGRWKTKVLSVAVGLGLGGTQIYIDNTKAQPPLPHWLYSDWVPLFPTVWKPASILAPVLFFCAAGFSVWAIFRLAKAHIRREPLSTQYFSNWLVLLC